MEKGLVPSWEGGEEGGSSRPLSASSQLVWQHRQQLQAAGFSSHLAGASPSTMILWLWLCWGFSTSAGQPDSELMARYLEEKLMADYSIMEQVGFKVVVVRERLVAGAGLAPL